MALCSSVCGGAASKDTWGLGRYSCITGGGRSADGRMLTYMPIMQEIVDLLVDARVGVGGRAVASEESGYT